MTTSQPTFVLVRPQMGENIGAAARAMWNFGLDRLRLVNPRDGWPNQKAVALASGAGRVLDQASVSSSLIDAVEGADYVFATTARPRDLTKRVLTPRAAMQDANVRTGKGEKVAVIFGPERAGLENEDIARANAIISVPSNPDFPSLNLAQCVLLVAYEWRAQLVDASSDEVVMAGTEWAKAEEINRLATHYEEKLETVGFFYPPEKAAGMKVTLRNLWSRMAMTRADVQIMHGVLRQLVRRDVSDEMQADETK